MLALIYDHAPNAPELGRALYRLAADGVLVICGVVYAELLAGPERPKTELDAFLQAVGITLDPDMGEVVWAEAGRANADYHARRRAGGFPQPRPVLPDFLVGAHALHRADRLYTENVGDFSDFPALTVIEALR
ncbi:type II toxin-antitoxin system VapC family toxin [Deinococcus frigens]|uniref:type II toxin-antitoxin system VapC family toxin n=1 Tax=Deinococcus frigens TaxID=249403 RepID=UPI00068A8B9A|nr:type II toxin-antitoxin system VapC family toxin [Deinococcus frigens]